MARSFATRFTDALGFAYRKVALLISEDESDDGSAPTLTAGSAAPSASENTGSLYIRTATGALYRRIGGAWETVLGAAGTLTADAISELTSAAGVTIDGLLLKDGYVAAADNQGLKLGNTAAAPDITIAWDGTRLNVTQGTANSEIRWGVDGAGIDQKWYTDTASQSFTLDQSADALVMTAAVSITGQGSTVVPVIPIAAQQALSGAGAINITSYYTAWTTTAANAGTLANGAQKGQLKKIQLIVDGGDGTLTPTSLSGGTTITFADAGDFAILCWNGTAWVAIELGNDADGATAPVLA
jgi:hypothetical protein